MKNFSMRWAMALLLLLGAAGQVSASALGLRIPYTPCNFSRVQTMVAGVVVDEVGPVGGAAVSLKGGAVLGMTDMEGRFSVAAKPGDALVVSAPGYKAREVVVRDGSILSIVLEPEAELLREVVVNAGYYTVKEKERTGGIARVTAADIGKQPVANPLAALQGRMAGVSVTQSTGVAGGGFDIRIRGTNSLRADGNAPLYIVDGMPFLSASKSSPDLFGGILPAGGASPLNGINPSDIESIEILKDADATAIYGSRGANGVVLITTKKGRAGKARFSVNAWTGTGKVTRRIEMMKTAEYLAMREEAYANDGFDTPPSWAYDVNGTWSRDRYTDWQEELIGGTSLTRNLDAAVSGGSQQTRFTLRGTSYGETSVFPGDFEYVKRAAHASVTYVSVDDRFRFNFAANYVSDDNDLPGSDLSRDAVYLAPNAPALYEADGSLNWEDSTWANPLAQSLVGYRLRTNTLTANAVLGYKLWPFLEFRASMGYADNRLEESRRTPHTVYDPSWGLTSAYSASQLNTSAQQSYNLEPQLEYARDFGKGRLSALAGATFQESAGSQLGLYGSGFANNSILGNLSAAAQKYILYDTDNQYRYNAVFARINYSHAGKYFLNLTGRRDGSSRFGPGNRFANFGAVGAAWIWGEEDAVRRALPFLSFGKLRASYGSTGSDQLGDYQFLDTYAVTGNNYQGFVGLAPARLYNPDFSWEENRKFEAALDLGFLGDRIALSAAFYRNRSSSQLVGIPLPGTTGFGSIQANLAATVQNSGLELELRTANVKGQEFKWSTTANLTVPRTKLIEFPDLETSTYANTYAIGQSLNIVKLYDFVGVNPDTGLYDYADLNGDGVISSAGDRKKIVDLSPDWFAGLQNTLSYKGWQLDVLFQFVRQLGANYRLTSGMPGVAVNQPSALPIPWREPGDAASVQQYSAGFNDAASLAFDRYSFSDAAYSDASFVRLKNLSLSYTLPSSWLPQAECRLYMQGQNLLTFTRYKGRDPEVQSLNTLPPLRILSFGISLNL